MRSNRQEMMSVYSAIAIDYDGTLTRTPRPSAEVLAAVREARAQGRKVLLCTGRILDELRTDFPEVQDHFDAIVGENGAVALTRTGERALAPAVPAELETALHMHGVNVRRGRVLLATEARAAQFALAEIQRLGLDCQLIRNRNALMVLPTGVSKGTGLRHVLGELGLSCHSTIAIGDAENDISLIDACELGVAVGDAVDSLKAHADVVLSESNGRGVTQFLQGKLVKGEIQVHPRRWQVQLGRYLDGSPALLPASQINVLIRGATGSGKSYMAGLFAERLIGMGYSLCILDPEGDYESLGRLQGVLVLGGTQAPPAPALLARLLHNRFSSVVVDLALVDAEGKRVYCRDALAELEGLRAETGLPHWIFVDEADQLMQKMPVALQSSLPATGFCLVSYHPDAVPPHALSNIDHVIALPDPAGEAAWPLGHAPAQTHERDGRPLLAMLETRLEQRPFRVGERLCPHVRHWHKYLHGSLPAHLRFFFRDAAGNVSGSAGNIADFRSLLGRSAAAIVEHHLRGGDFSRWIRDVLQDTELADDIARIEKSSVASTVNGGAAKRLVLRAIEQRYCDRACNCLAVAD